MNDFDRLRLLLPDPTGVVHLAGVGAFIAFLGVLTAVLLAGFVVSLIFCGACYGHGDIYDVPPQHRHRGRPVDRSEW